MSIGVNTSKCQWSLWSNWSMYRTINYTPTML